MAVTDLDYLAQLQALLPSGSAWSRDADALMTRLLHAEADGLARIDARSLALVAESDPRATEEMLVDWERNYGLPGDCMDLAATPDQRRQRLVQKVVWRGGQSIAFFLGLLGSLGYQGATLTNSARLPLTVPAMPPSIKVAFASLGGSTSRATPRSARWTVTAPATCQSGNGAIQR